MKAIAVTPGKANSVHLEDVPKPSVTDVPDGRGVLVRVLRVGVDGTIGLLMALAARLRGLELTVASLPRPPYRNSELIEQLGGTYVSTQEKSLAELSTERGPFDLIMDATGFSPIIWEAAEALGKNGVLVLSSITGGERKVEINSDAINQSR